VAGPQVAQHAGRQPAGGDGERGDRHGSGDRAAVFGDGGRYPLRVGQQVAGVAGEQRASLGQH
jgi:hypothetical protein